jgi:hypothetical protein
MKRTAGRRNRNLRRSGVFLTEASPDREKSRPGPPTGQEPRGVAVQARVRLHFGYLSRFTLPAPIRCEGGETMKSLLIRIVPTVVLLAVPGVVLAAGKAVEMACCAGGHCCPLCPFC